MLQLLLVNRPRSAIKFSIQKLINKVYFAAYYLMCQSNPSFKFQ